MKPENNTEMKVQTLDSPQALRSENDPLYKNFVPSEEDLLPSWVSLAAFVSQPVVNLYQLFSEDPEKTRKRRAKESMEFSNQLRIEKTEQARQQSLGPNPPPSCYKFSKLRSASNS